MSAMLHNSDGTPGNNSGARFHLIKLCKDRVFLFLFILTALTSLYYAIQGWDGSLMQRYAFRQTQTAITVQQMLKGGPLLQYETPVLGPPWSIPLEFPLYQYIVYILVKLTGYSLEPAGRLVSLLFFGSLLFPFYFLTKPYFADSSRGYIALLLLCSSPQYLFWSRSFLIESTVLALSLWYLYFLKKQCDREVNYAQNSGKSFLLLALILGTGAIAAITKVTTFFIYASIVALFVFA